MAQFDSRRANEGGHNSDYYDEYEAEVHAEHEKRLALGRLVSANPTGSPDVFDYAEVGERINALTHSSKTWLGIVPFKHRLATRRSVHFRDRPPEPYTGIRLDAYHGFRIGKNSPLIGGILVAGLDNGLESSLMRFTLNLDDNQPNLRADFRNVVIQERVALEQTVLNVLSVLEQQ